MTQNEHKKDATPHSVVVIRDASEHWTAKSFKDCVEARPKNPLLERIAKRRQQLSKIAPRPLDQSYSGSLVKTSGAGANMVHPKTISLPPAYGQIIYMLCSRHKARLILEGGAGFGISTMYLSAAANNVSGGKVVSFEIAQYADVAQRSADMMAGNAHVYRDDFLNFHLHIDAKSVIDFAFIDSRHDEDAIVRSIKTLSGWLSERGMIVIDDINYSESSRNGFNAVIQSETFSFVALINTRLGVLAK